MVLRMIFILSSLIFIHGHVSAMDNYVLINDDVKICEEGTSGEEKPKPKPDEPNPEDNCGD